VTANDLDLNLNVETTVAHPWSSLFISCTVSCDIFCMFSWCWSWRRFKSHSRLSALALFYDFLL